jgi:C4-dicarboxylate-specific signal transduction histidine kinase
MSSSQASRESPSPQHAEDTELHERIATLEARVQAGEERRRAMLHIMGDLADSNRQLANQRRAMLHILSDYERDRKDLGQQTERMNNSRRALMHILQDAHESNVKLGESRKAMIHIMGDLRRTTEEISHREQELREKQEQLVQAAKLATLGELTTGIAHELNNPLNNIGLYVGNVLDRLAYDGIDTERIEHDLLNVMTQVRKATEIINHLRTFGRTAASNHEPVAINQVILDSVSLLREQLRLREVDLVLDLDASNPVTLGNSIQLEQVMMNLLSNARDALANSPDKSISVRTYVTSRTITVMVRDSGSGIDADLRQRIFDPFFTTKDVGEGTGLGLSIVYGIVKEHRGTIEVESLPEEGATFILELPLAQEVTA